MNIDKQNSTRHLFPNRLTKEEEIRKRDLEARRNYDSEMDRHEKYIHHLNAMNGIGVKHDDIDTQEVNHEVLESNEMPS